MRREKARVNERNPSRTGCELVEIGTKGITFLFLFFIHLCITFFIRFREECLFSLLNMFRPGLHAY